MLFAFPSAVGTVVIIVAFLLGSRESAATDMTLKESSETKEVSLWPFMDSTIEDFLSLLKEFFRDDRLMIAGVVLAFPLHDTVVERVDENLVDFAFPILATSLGTEAFLIQNIGYLLRAFATRNVHFKDTHDEWTHVLIHDNAFSGFVIEIAYGSHTWPITFFELGSIASADIDGEIIDILFGNAEIKAHEKLVVSDVLNRLFPSANFLDNAPVHEPRDLAAVEGISGEAVEFPNDNAKFTFSSLEKTQHFLKNRPSGGFGGHTLGKDPFNDETIPCS